jgi:hypothetical protein
LTKKELKFITTKPIRMIEPPVGTDPQRIKIMKTELCDVCGELLDELDFYTVWDSVCKVCDEIHPTHRLGHAPRKRRKGSPGPDLPLTAAMVLLGA